MENIFVKATSEGKLYIETSDFFKQPKIIETIYKLKNSKIVKEIDSVKLKDMSNIKASCCENCTI